MRRLVAFGFLLAALVAGCSSDDSAADEPAKCVPGQTVSCSCSGGIQGAQTCKADGSGYGACASCGISGSGGGGAWPGFDGGGGTGGGSGGASGGSAGSGGDPGADADVPDAPVTHSWVWVDHGGPAFQPHACPDGPGVSGGMLVDPQAFFTALIQGKDPNDWVNVLNAIEPQLWACGIGQQRDSGGNVRGRLFLPHAACPNAAPPSDDPLGIKLGVRQQPPCWDHQVDVVGNN